MQDNTYDPDWDIYFCNIESKPAYIGLDLNLYQIAPLRDINQVIEVTIKLLTNQVNGFPQQEEWQSLGEMEDELAQKLEEELEAVFAGKTLCDGNRKFFFYTTHITLYDKYISDVMSKFPKYEYDFDAYEDKEWNTYFDFLYPEPIDIQKISNSRVVRHLQEQGDQQEVPRQIDHWIYFQNESDRETYWQAIQEKGFKLETLEVAEYYPEKAYKLHVSRIDKADEETINEVCIELWLLANEHNGDYDGWETLYIKAQS